jgi:hypothetical protein
MGRKSKNKTRPPADPARIQRLRAVRQQDAQIRATLDRGHTITRELADRMHYDKLAKQCAERSQVLAEELPKLLERHIEVFGECLSANYEMGQECEELQRQLDVREGRPPQPDALERIEPILKTLPKEQAEKMRLRIALGTVARKRVHVDPDTFEKARSYVATLDAHLAAFRHEAEVCIEIHAEVVRRAWASSESLESGRKAIEEHLLKIEGDVTHRRELLRKSLADSEALQKRRQTLTQALGQILEDPQ